MICNTMDLFCIILLSFHFEKYIFKCSNGVWFGYLQMNIYYTLLICYKDYIDDNDIFCDCDNI